MPGSYSQRTHSTTVYLGVSLINRDSGEMKMHCDFYNIRRFRLACVIFSLFKWNKPARINLIMCQHFTIVKYMNNQYKSILKYMSI